MKKWTFISLLLVFITCFCSCSDDNNKPETKRDITVENSNQLMQSIFADETTGESQVSFTTNGAWTSEIYGRSLKSLQKENYEPEPSPEWITITPDEGKEAGDYDIEINLAQNMTGVDRRASITISCGESYITITITQKATKEDGTVPGGNTGGYIKKINGTEVHYNDKNQVTGFGNEMFTNYTIKGGSYDQINLVYISNNNWQYDYTFDGGYIRYIEYTPNIYNSSKFELTYKQGDNGNIYLTEGDPVGISADHFMSNVFEYSDKEYPLGNLDISFLLASDRYFYGPIYVAFDGNAGTRSKHLISKAKQTLPGVDGKYDEERVYTYDFNEDGYITHIYSNNQLVYTLEY